MSELEQCKQRLKRAKEALQIIAIWAACDISSPDSREKAMRDIQEKAMEGLHKDD